MDWHSMTGWKRLALMGLMVCLPIPMLAASGLAVPLPSVVYRVAVGVAERTQAVAVHVPGFESVVAETKQVARRGTIRFSPEEQAVAGAHTRVRAAAGEERPQRAGSVLRPRSRSVPGPKSGKKLAARALPATHGARAAPEAERDHGTRAVAAPERQEPREHLPPARDERVAEPKASAPAEGKSGESTAGTKQPPESRTSPPKEQPKNTTEPAPPPPPPPPATPPALPPVPVTPPIDPLPEPVPVTPKAQLEEIAAELREIAETPDDDDGGGRVGQAVEKIESAVERLEKKPPDEQGAIGDIKNAVQKLDAALAEGEISIAEHTLFVTRLNAVSQLIKGSS